MKKLTLVLCLCITPVFALQADSTVQSYTHKSEFGFLYGSWKDRTTPTNDGVEIGGSANLSGGGGNNLHPALDLTDETKLEVTLEALPGNEADTLNILLRTRTGPGDQDYKTTRYSYYIGDMTDYETATLSLPLAPVKGAASEDGPVDLTKVDQIQVQGNYSNSKSPMHIKIVKIMAKS